MNKLNLDANTILEKEFNVDIKGYSAKEVDVFLDAIYEDYQAFEAIIREYHKKLVSLQKTNEKLMEELDANLNNQTVSNVMVQTEQINTIDILQRLSNLEKEIYNKKED